MGEYLETCPNGSYEYSNAVLTTSCVAATATARNDGDRSDAIIRKWDVTICQMTESLDELNFVMSTSADRAKFVQSEGAKSLDKLCALSPFEGVDDGLVSVEKESGT